MKVNSDTFGLLLKAYYNGRCVFQVIERDDGYISVNSMKPYFTNYDDWQLTEKEAISYAKGKVLDIGCGAGRHSLYLQRQGFDVYSTDISPLAIEICKLRGLKKTKIVSIEDLDFKPNTFDTILMLGNNFGLFANYQKAKKLLQKFHNFTTNNAWIITDTLDPSKTAIRAHLDYHKKNRDKGRMIGQARIRDRYDIYASEWYDLLLVSQTEMIDILKGTGWQVKKFLDPNEPHYYALIEKV